MAFHECLQSSKPHKTNIITLEDQTDNNSPMN